MILCDKCNTEMMVAELPASITGPLEAVALFKGIANHSVEHVQVAYLDARNRVLEVRTVSIGGLRSAIIQPRDILAGAVTLPCGSLILCHNHPSNDPTPSQEDIAVTSQLVQACKVLGVELLDHIIVAGNRSSSLRELGHI